MILNALQGAPRLCHIYLDIYLDIYLNVYLNIYQNVYLNIYLNVHLDLYLTLHPPHLAATPLHTAESTNRHVNLRIICSMASSFVNSKKTKTLKTT